MQERASRDFVLKKIRKALLVKNESEVQAVDFDADVYASEEGELLEIFAGNFENNKESENFIKLLLALPKKELTNKLKETIKNLIEEIIGAPLSTKNDLDKNFQDMGIDSLMLIDIRNKLQILFKPKNLRLYLYAWAWKGNPWLRHYQLQRSQTP